ncbi:MAG: hypothetical protein A2Y03_10735 [Omnitrophica WOR_2 bacterium GWF2_38_59]|nr:MAG: hypothetical protein A2Y03_10735 [Omnitrophica WOR_2 bacterium GWF2_38_59]OGX50645.1 MAG: hypothetical protein A2243_03500 [Omnitrophica WOR_2 bacterium RIFOXYA2_FULL_38_17]OGX56174.1 MAG: hypothetical protein A2447_07910 [Omnitrophica WOR_2 bacterium RIFOXYC2_FULL_38_12]HBG60937.1 acyl-[ACP]--phospholipid O-acyltransferase [Candidatus Omnitrophota bacterium]
MMDRKCDSKSFKALMVTQFLGAFADNAFKIIISLFAMRILLDTRAHAQFVSIVGALFIIPFIIVSPYAGYFADRFRKRDIIVLAKIAEIVIMILGFFALSSGSLVFMCIILFLMATQSAFFGPAKYGVLPELLDESELSKGNGFMQMWTFLAIILGTASGGQLITLFSVNVQYSSFVLIFISVAGTISSLFISKGEAASTKTKFELNFIKDSFLSLKEIIRKKPLFHTLLSVAFFWFLGLVIQMNTIVYGKNILGLSDMKTSLLVVFASIGIGVGSALAGRLSGNKIEFGIVPLGAIGVTLSCLFLGEPNPSFAGAIIRLIILGLSAGFYIVPLNTFFQQKSPANKRGKYLALLNVTNSFGILLGSIFLWFCGSFMRFDPAQVFFTLGILSVIGTALIFKYLPDAFLRFFNWVLTHTFYKIKVVGEENLPDKGGVLLVCNHVSYVDPSLILASTKRHVRFLVFRKIYDSFFLKPLCKIMKAIPVSLHDSPKEIVKSLNEARKAVEEGHVVCIFAEGGLTRTGNLLPFNRGFQHIMKDLDAPIVPVNIDCIWGSIFSYDDGKFFWKMPKRALYPVTISYGKPMPANSQAHEVRLAVQELWAKAFNLRGKYQEKLHMAFIREAKKRPFKFALADSTGMKLNYIEALGSVIMFSKKLFPRNEDPIDKESEMIGVLLPSSCLGAVVNGAALMVGKVPVNLNFTASKESIASAIKQCEMKKIITSRKFLSKVNIHEQEGMIFLEDLKEKISKKEKVLSVLNALMMPMFLIKNIYVRGDKYNVNDMATVIFSSGSTGEPKGVMLSHANIFSNVEGFYQVGQVKRNDVVMGVLPFFHSFGFTACMCFPLGTGLGVVYHPNPLDASTIGNLIQKYKATIIVGTPTFFSAYIRKCTKEQFSTLRLAVAGAEKFKEKVATDFTEKFGIVPFEGYGATELSPIVSMGVPDFENESGTIKQTGNKAGKVGQPIPGVVAKVVDPDTFELLADDKEGLLLIKGANVMKGYLNNPQKTQEVLRDGWYITGDIATIDKEGFICITDRLSRFSKIGGEMVPHVKVEEEILNVLNTSEPVCTVTSVSDEKKGEKLVVLYVGDINVDDIVKQLGERALPNLWIPKKDCFFKIDEIPMLGSGKMDLKTIKAKAKELSEVKGAE